MLTTIEWPRVIALWRASGRTEATTAQYAYWSRRYVDYCIGRGRAPLEHLTHRRVARFVLSETRTRARRDPSSCTPLTAVRALSCALSSLGHNMPAWRAPPPKRRLSGIVAAFVGHRERHRGVAPATIPEDVRVATRFLAFLRRRGRRVALIRITDVDDFVVKLSSKCVPKSVAATCSTRRAFLRFLHATRRLPVDVASSVAAPRIRSVDRPLRSIPWSDVQRILRAVDVQRAPGRRDFAIFLMMATYGMGAGEVCGLRLEDIDWAAKTFVVRRPKTGNTTVLPLLDPVGRALVRYLRHERPAHAQDRSVFVTDHMPHRALGGSTTIRHRLDLYARAAGVRAEFLGTHVFRHTHATRQIEGGAPPKIVGDILGHRRHASTSVYVRGAIVRLRAIALPVPR